MTEQFVIYNASTTTAASWEYDDDGNVGTQVDALGRTTESYYDDSGNVTDEIDAAGSSVAATTFSSYDKDGNMTLEYTPAAGSSPASTTSFTYEDGNMTTEVNAMTYASTFAYDGSGQMTSEIDADGRTQSFGYDAMGHETSNVWYNSSGTQVEDIEFGYDANGNMTLAQEVIGGTATSSYTMEYDPLNRLTQVTEPEGSTTVSLSMGYDAAGDRTLLADNLGGTLYSYYDTAQELTGELCYQNGTAAMEFSQAFDWEGRVVEQARYVGATGPYTLIDETTFGYNADGELTLQDEYDNPLSTMVADYTLAYDADQELTQEIDIDPNAATATTTTDYGYDDLGNLTSYGTAAQSYDADGNRTGDTVNAGNEVTYDGTYSYGYDHEGNETLMYETGETWSYTYDNENHMTSATETTVSGTTTTTVDVDYGYDAFGNMTEEMVTTVGVGSAVTTLFVMDDWNPAESGTTGNSGNSVLADLNGSGTLETHYVWDDQVGQMVARYDAVSMCGCTSMGDPEGIYFAMTDQNGSVRDVVNSSGTIVDSLNYDAFGNLLAESNSTYQGSTPTTATITTRRRGFTMSMRGLQLGERAVVVARPDGI